MKDKTISQAGESNGAPLPRCRVLVVEDDSGLLRLNTEILKRSGYDVDTAEDGAAAWDTLQLNNYDLMITDNKMPKLSGVELLKKLQAAGVVLPVIMATGESPEMEFVQFPWLRPGAILSKPYTIAELLGTVKQVLREAEGADDGSQLFKYRDVKDNKISPAGRPAGVPRQRPTNFTRRILVVDDDSDTRQLSVDVLAGFGYDVEAAIDGAAGWEERRAALLAAQKTRELQEQVMAIRMLPIGTVYDPFVNRGLDALIYACYQDARFLLVSTPSGLTLAPEGGQHQSITTPLIGMAADRLASFEPAHVDELAILLRHGRDRIVFICDGG